jgi:hypothetical protein
MDLDRILLKNQLMDIFSLNSEFYSVDLCGFPYANTHCLDYCYFEATFKIG